MSAWLLLFGDNDHWFYHSVWYTALAIGLVTSTIVTFRARRRSRKYFYIHLWLSVALLIVYAGNAVQAYAAVIDGITVEAASERVLRRLAHGRAEEPRLKPDPKTPRDELRIGRDPSRLRTFWIMNGTEPIVRFTLYKDRIIGWRYVSSRALPSIAEQLTRINELLRTGKRWERDVAISILREIEENYPSDYPGTEKSRALLESLGEPDLPD